MKDALKHETDGAPHAVGKDAEQADSSKKPVSRRNLELPKPVAIGIYTVIAGFLLASAWVWWRGRQNQTPQAPAASTAKGKASESGPWVEFQPQAANAAATSKAGESAPASGPDTLSFEEATQPDRLTETNFAPDSLAALRARAEKGDAAAQAYLGWCYYAGQGVAQDYAEAVKWFRKAAEHGDAEAQFALGSFCETGEGVAQDDAEAVKWYRMAAEQGNADAQWSLSVCYILKRGVPFDAAELAKWVRKAAEQGNPNAQSMLAGFYFYGHVADIPKDEAEAVKWDRKAAEQGHAGAQCSLGECYGQGQGVAKDAAEAAKWFRKAAEQGNTCAQADLGGCYYTGEGVPPNDIEAYKWLSLAAAHGLEDAATLRDSVCRRMARAEIVEGQRRAAAFVARKESLDSSGSFGAKPLPRSARFAEKASGTAFFITEDGYLLSNNHVIQGAARIMVKTSSGLWSASIVKTDPVNDIALLKVSGSFRAVPLASSREGKMGDSVFTVGFPNIGLQGTEAKFTKGEISSLSGVQDDPREFQISVAVQPGNSGGPLVNAAGNVVGIVTARLSDAAGLESSGMLPQNVNYATKISYALPLLESVPGLAGNLKPPHPATPRQFEGIVQEARAAAALVLVY